MEYRFLSIPRRLKLDGQSDFLNQWTRQGWKVHSLFWDGSNILLLVERDDGRDKAIEELKREIDALRRNQNDVETRIERLIAILSPEQQIELDFDQEAFRWAFDQLLQKTEVQGRAQVNRTKRCLARARVSSLRVMEAVLKGERPRPRNFGVHAEAIAREALELGKSYIEEKKKTLQVE